MMKKLLLILSVMPLLSYGQWNLLNATINGEAPQDWSGKAVSINNDGNIVAIAAPFNDGNGNDSGHVRVFENVSGTWTQIGSDIDGEAAGDNAGSTGFGGFESLAISLNAAGNIIAIGAHTNDSAGANSGHVRVFENVSGTWAQIGQTISGSSVSQFLGWAVSLNANGNKVAIGGPGTFSTIGIVKTYELINNTWTQYGADITGEANGDFFGISLSLNDNGNAIAIGGKLNDGNGADAGHVRVYGYSSGITSKGAQANWAQIGTDIDGEAAGDNFGESVSINGAGNIVAIGARMNANTGGGNSGHVRVFENISNTWTQIGADIDAVAANDEFGISVSLDTSGSRLVAGARLNDGTGFNAIGHVRVFDNISGTWTQVYGDVIGGAIGNEFGTSVAISGDGTTFIGGAPRNAANGASAGQARVYRDGVLSVNDFSSSTFSLYPNPIETYFNINSNSEISKVEIIDVKGQLVKSFDGNHARYDIGELQSGLYIVKLFSDRVVSTKKLLKN